MGSENKTTMLGYFYIMVGVATMAALIWYAVESHKEKTIITQALNEAIENPTEDNVEKARTLYNNGRGSQVGHTTQMRKLDKKLLYIKAKNTLKLAQDTGDKDYLVSVQNLVKTMDKGMATDIIAQLADVSMQIELVQIRKARVEVEQVERTRRVEDYVSAESMVDDLNEGKSKNDLKNRLVTLKGK